MFINCPTEVTPSGGQPGGTGFHFDRKSRMVRFQNGYKTVLFLFRLVTFLVQGLYVSATCPPIVITVKGEDVIFRIVFTVSCCYMCTYIGYVMIFLYIYPDKQKYDAEYLRSIDYVRVPGSGMYVTRNKCKRGYY